MPVYYWLSRWLSIAVCRGAPQRRGHGATGGELAEVCWNIVRRQTTTCLSDCSRRYCLPRSIHDRAKTSWHHGTFCCRHFHRELGIVALASRNIPSRCIDCKLCRRRGGMLNGRPNAICNLRWFAFYSITCLARRHDNRASGCIREMIAISPYVALALARQWQLGWQSADAHL